MGRIMNASELGGRRSYDADRDDKRQHVRRIPSHRRYDSRGAGMSSNVFAPFGIHRLSAPISHSQAEQIGAALEAALRDERMDLVQPEVRQYFTGHGLYAREIKIKAGTFIVGLPHTEPCISVLSEGVHETITTDHGTQRQYAPHTCVSPAGMQRVGYAHTDCTWTTFHITPFQDDDPAVMLFHICEVPKGLFEEVTPCLDFS